MAPSSPVRIVDEEGRPITASNPLPTSATLELEGDVQIDFPEGLATEAKQDAGNARLADIETAAETLAGAVDGTEVQVDVVGSLPAGDNNIGNVDIVTLPTPPASVHHGVKTVTSAGTAEALASSQAIVSGVTIKALSTNTGLVYVGDSDVDSTNGFELDAGEQVFIEVANLATVYVDAAENGEGVSYLAS